MNFEEFKQQIMEDLPGALPERLSNVEIEPVSVTKLQHGSYDGITIREETNIKTATKCACAANGAVF